MTDYEYRQLPCTVPAHAYYQGPLAATSAEATAISKWWHDLNKLQDDGWELVNHHVLTLAGVSLLNKDFQLRRRLR